jgi:hypothetical protein
VAQVYLSPGGANLNSGGNPNFAAFAGSGVKDSLVNGTNIGPSDYPGTPGAGHDAVSILLGNQGAVAQTLNQVEQCQDTKMFLPKNYPVGKDGSLRTETPFGTGTGMSWYWVFWSCTSTGGGPWVCSISDIRPVK